ncbi:hypothetical protein RXV86_18170 [Alisedimentitalea sp. MJ-SS2]|uniref:hypothetical protein n=1 Tax=Aliisedimentitalea sp. MJ-SS2 TaxID=3049795 RepID=UPI00290BEA94|nr:hypothetical protein [Alisedimentitalea sp. MJ-SS2]MDU8929323.1 hypothetical protein [Alisedimentitalea sp. MJ-SS2]
MSETSERPRFEEPFPLLRAAGHPVFWGFWATVAVLAVVIWMGTLEDCGLTGGITGSCATKAEQFWSSKPHDMAAVGMAVAGALGVVWLIVLAWVQARAVKWMRLGVMRGNE